MSLFDLDVAALNDEVVAEFGDTFEYVHAASSMSFPMMGIFSSTLTREESAAAASFHELFVRSAQFVAPPQRGDVVIFLGREYTVFDWKVDHGGGCKLALNISTCL